MTAVTATARWAASQKVGQTLRTPRAAVTVAKQPTGFARAFHGSAATFRATVPKSALGRGLAATRRGFVTAGLVVGTLAGSAYLWDSRAAIYPYVVMPALRLFDAEDTHAFSIQLAKWGLVPRDTSRDQPEPALETKLWGKTVVNPLGLAAGYDKNGEAIDAMYGLGFGLVEVGSITPAPQPGNPRPRVFRLPEEKACINRYGFNSQGHEATRQRLVDRFWRKAIANQPGTDDETTAAAQVPVEQQYRSGVPGRLLGINLGKNTNSPQDSYDDYVRGVQAFGALADYLVVNVSCPNTPGQRDQQKGDKLEQLLKQVVSERDQLEGHRPPLVVKISPDLSEAELTQIAQASLKARVDGIIVSNTTTQRPRGLHASSAVLHERGGLSGPPVQDLSLQALKTVYRLTRGEIPLIGCGGIGSGADALRFARAGASAVQIYTSMSYDGPGVPRRIKDEVVQLLEGQKWSSVVGKDA
ncbi:dihydroorotate dehydrogenase [Dimargaris verticillata]|uniref:Dihydroorotate dehydrogenase (quinone), mitochondrial n=1 Tax=Dimargaris verticillata TaxID=2761393 RepID=A0A9W8B2V2_9FUNG|nr:dihydroorotate dehydrogenase [Dimargaris verticillata]